MTIKRWTDEMLDELASSVDELRDSVSEVKNSVSDIKDSIDGLRVTAQALLQVAAQSQRKMENFEEELELMKQKHQEDMTLMKQKHEEDMTLMKQRFAESDQRFNILLEEVRFLIRGKQED